MANRSLFSAESVAVAKLPKATTHNDAGGAAYEADPKYALALYACTGTFNGTYYASEKQHLDRVQELLNKIKDPYFIAQVAVYGRQKSHMKDVPAYLLAHLFAISVPKETTEEAKEYAQLAGRCFMAAFPKVITNGKMACTFWQIVRSGVTGRKSLGVRGQKAFQVWFDEMSDAKLFNTSIGASKPSIVDVINVSRPTPRTDSRRALVAYLQGKTKPPYPCIVENLPAIVKEVEAFKKDPANTPIPGVNFQLLSSFPLGKKQWTEIALKAPWQTLRMNLNTFKRHGVFEDQDVVQKLAEKLRDPMEVGRSRVFPYQILIAYLMSEGELPSMIRSALHDAMEHSVINVPIIEGNLAICIDISGSMMSPITGTREKSPSSKIRNVDVAALITACLLRKNPSARILPFNSSVIDLKKCPLEPGDTIMTNARKLSDLCCGGTSCGAPLALLNKEKAKIDHVYFVSDGESWVQSRIDGGSHAGAYGNSAATEMAVEWARLHVRNPQSKMICHDISPQMSLQVEPGVDTLLVGGFSDEVFNVASLYLSGALEKDQWLKRITEEKLY